MNKELIVLIGLPGAGKSTYCKERLYGTHVRINQDSLGDRGTCLKLLDACFKSGINAVVDRCNINAQQRSYWIQLAKKNNYAVKAVYIKTPVEVCEQRVIARESHETINNMSDSRKSSIVQDFKKSLQTPCSLEGINVIMYLDQDLKEITNEQTQS
jgi:predicted kinase